LDQPIFYVVEVALPAADLAEFAPWYAAVHAPHLFAAGFNCCTSYLAVSGGMSVVDIYQARGWSMFIAPEFAHYRGIVFADPYRPAVLGRIDNTRTVYLHHDPSPLSSPDPSAPLDADWISIWRIDGDAEVAAQLADWLRDGGARALGAVRVRLLHRGPDAPTGTSIRPPLALICEWQDVPPAPVQDATAAPDWLRGRIGADGLFTGVRSYPWAASASARALAARLVDGG
jgi:hypothetical protein